MNQQQIVRIAKAKDAIATIESIATEFLANCTKNAVPKEFSTKLQVSGQSISVDAFGYIATANARTVIDSSGEFAVEYIFRIDHGDKPLEVSGRLHEASPENVVGEREEPLFCVPFCRTGCPDLEKPLICTKNKQVEPFFGRCLVVAPSVVAAKFMP